jgi:cytidyltransferase-like protein
MQLNEFKISQVIAIYGGRFQPFHKGHKQVYDWLTERFETVWVVSSNSVDLPKSPFSFEEKKKMMIAAGIPEDVIVEVKSPYKAREVTDRYNVKNTTAVYAISEKDMGEDPRFKFEKKRDGSDPYFMPFDLDNMEPIENHSYLLTVPTFEFDIMGQSIDSATEIRQMFINANNSEEVDIITELYGDYDPDIHDIFDSKLAAVAAVDDADS